MKAGLVFRDVEEDIMIGGYRFRKGAIIIPLLLNHINADIFGDNVDMFVPDHFIHDISILPGKRSPGVKALKPSGGGTSLFPGL